MDKFKLWVEFNDPFGFDEIKAKRDLNKIPPDEEELPIKSFNTQWMMDALARQKIGRRIRSSHAFIDEVVWGEKKVGSVRVRPTPNLTIFLERMIDDMLGQRTWICKAVFRPDIARYAGNEEIVAYDIFDEVEKLYFNDIDKASDEYKQLLTLSKQMAGVLRSQAPEIYSYQDTKEVTKDHYVIYFAIRNVGVGKLVTRRQHITMSPEATVDVTFNRERGLLHIILTTVSVGAGKGEGGWEVDIPFLDAWYAPSQTKSEIISTVSTTLKFY